MSTSTSRYAGDVKGLDALRLLLGLLHERRGLLGDVVLGRVVAHVLRDLHRAEVRTGHGAEVGELAPSAGSVSSWNSRAVSGSSERLNWSSQRNSKRAFESASSHSRARGLDHDLAVVLPRDRRLGGGIGHHDRAGHQGQEGNEERRLPANRWRSFSGRNRPESLSLHRIATRCPRCQSASEHEDLAVPIESQELVRGVDFLHWAIAVENNERARLRKLAKLLRRLVKRERARPGDVPLLIFLW